MATGFDTKREVTASADQYASWAYYGLPATVVTQTGKARKTVACAVGEVRYVVGWMADQMSRMDWEITIDDDPAWSLEVPGGDTIVSNPEADSDDAEHPRNASAALLKRVGWGSSVVRQVTTNLFVAGECDYCVKADDDKGDQWTVVSVIHPNRAQLLANAQHAIRALWPHPADPDAPDAPLFGVLDILEELVWLSLVSRGQSRNRAAMRGIIVTADNVEFANGSNFWDAWNEALQAEIKDPGASGPISLRAAESLMNTTRGPVDWIVPEMPYDQRIDDRIAAAIKRLAYGLPIPPELLLGLQAPSRATAEFFDADRYRSHIEPIAKLIADVACDALRFILSDGTEVKVTPDPTEMLAKRSSVEDAKDAFDRGAIGFAYLREVLGIPEDAELTEDDLSLLIRLGQLGAGPVLTQPGSEGPATASIGSREDDPMTRPELDQLADELALIDNTLLAELGGLTQQATERARERVGAKARTRGDLRAKIPKNIPNDQVVAYLGDGVLEGAGVPVRDIVEQSLAGLEAWWRRRVLTVQEQITDLLGTDAAPLWSDADTGRSARALIDATEDHVVQTLSSEIAQPLPADQRQRVIDVAGGA